MRRSRKRSAAIWSPSALRDVERIHEYVHPHSARAAARLVREILRTVDILEEQPELGPIVRDLQPAGRYRHVIIGNYRVIYRLEGVTPHVLRVWDSRRDPDRLQVPGHGEE
jgi:plasmid stabilization system protein ParE